MVHFEFLWYGSNQFVLDDITFADLLDIATVTQFSNSFSLYAKTWSIFMTLTKLQSIPRKMGAEPTHNKHK